MIHKKHKLVKIELTLLRKYYYTKRFVNDICHKKKQLFFLTAALLIITTMFVHFQTKENKTASCYACVFLNLIC